MMDKKDLLCTMLPIKQVAQVPNFYDPTIEKSLNHDVEIPGSHAIEKICRGEPLTELERKHVTYYIGTMIRRVPAARENALQHVPDAIESVADEWRDFFINANRSGEIDESTLAVNLGEIDSIRQRHLQHHPVEVTSVIETPWPFASWLIAIHAMNWRVLRTMGQTRFLTSDNPVHHFSGFGLVHAECELILPLSGDHLLHCSWQPCENMKRIDISDKYTKEFNRRTVLGAKRFLFFHERADWVFEVARNVPAQLNRIRWGS